MVLSLHRTYNDSVGCSISHTQRKVGGKANPIYVHWLCLELTLQPSNWAFPISRLWFGNSIFHQKGSELSGEMAEFWSREEMYQRILGHPAISENKGNCERSLELCQQGPGVMSKLPLAQGRRLEHQGGEWKECVHEFIMTMNK